MPTTRVLMETSLGPITLELDGDKAPKTTENFLAYVDEGFYDNTVFHRVIDGFMIQGGGFQPGMKEKKTRGPIKNESPNGLKNVRGAIAMARLPDPDTAKAQFFINVADNDFLDKNRYCVFGQVVEGHDVVDKIKAVATTTKAGHSDVPEQDVVIKSVKRA
jgi:peptidyl-prolyl cis-trans isomerase B (cyclophilin B)